MNTDKCIVDYCSTDLTALSARGLCSRHYRSIRRVIERGVTTWKELEEKGKALPDRRVATYNKLIGWINS